MCYNCGCGMKNDPMGKDHVHKGGGSLTEDSIEHMAKEWGMSVEDTKKEMLAMLKLELKDKS
jgi:hypothetical protein